VSRLLEFRERFEADASSESFLRQVEETVNELAGELGKEVRLDLAGFDQSLVPDDYRAFLRDALVQLVRNSISHGIEDPEKRRSLGKPQVGVIQLGARVMEDKLELDYRDDGTGIQIRLRKRLMEQGDLDPERVAAMSDNELAGMIFKTGISTSKEANIHGGRGVGMDLIRETVKKYGGRIIASFKPGRYTRFRIVLPVATG
jgi:two-component system chemotaxis sensor kinase CheA